MYTETIKKKKTIFGMEKIFANDVTDKDLTFNIQITYILIVQQQQQKTNNPIKKMSRTPKQTFLQRKYMGGQ